MMISNTGDSPEAIFTRDGTALLAPKKKQVPVNHSATRQCGQGILLGRTTTLGDLQSAAGNVLFRTRPRVSHAPGGLTYHT